MKAAAFTLRLSRRIVRLADDRNGMAAVEFAMVLPLMVTLYLGSVEISQGISINRKVTLAARSLADLASQPTKINNSEMTNILNASAAVVAPYPTATLKATVTQLAIDAAGKATVAWSDTLHGTAYPVGQVISLPTALAVPSSSLIFSEVEYNYKPTIGYVVTGTLTLKDKMYMRPRQAPSIGRSAS